MENVHNLSGRSSVRSRCPHQPKDERLSKQNLFCLSLLSLSFLNTSLSVESFRERERSLGKERKGFPIFAEREGSGVSRYVTPYGVVLLTYFISVVVLRCFCCLSLPALKYHRCIYMIQTQWVEKKWREIHTEP